MDIVAGQISKHLHAIKILFKVPLSRDLSLERFVYAYIILKII
jgi:hypothetical protein